MSFSDGNGLDLLRLSRLESLPALSDLLMTVDATECELAESKCRSLQVLRIREPDEFFVGKTEYHQLGLISRLTSSSPFFDLRQGFHRARVFSDDAKISLCQT